LRPALAPPAGVEHSHRWATSLAHAECAGPFDPAGRRRRSYPGLLAAAA